MPAWGWIVIAAGIVVLVALVIWRGMAKRRTGRLQDQFGPEYDRTLESSESKRKAEAELAEREERRRGLDIKPLSHAARARYIERWQMIQAEFVDHPRGAVTNADSLIQSVMQERGYPVDDFEQRAADVSVDHPEVVENYREGHRLSTAPSDGDGETENLRQAMRHYRALFDDLVEPDAADQPVTRGADDEQVADRAPAAAPRRAR